MYRLGLNSYIYALKKGLKGYRRSYPVERPQRFQLFKTQSKTRSY